MGDPSFEFCCRRVLFYLGEVENWHLNQIFWAVLFAKVEILHSILSLVGF